MTKTLLLVALLLSQTAQANEEEYRDTYFGTKCIGGYLFAYAIRGAYDAGVSIVQVFEYGGYGANTNKPIKCEEDDD